MVIVQIMIVVVEQFIGGIILCFEYGLRGDHDAGFVGRFIVVFVRVVRRGHIVRQRLCIDRVDPSLIRPQH